MLAPTLEQIREGDAYISLGEEGGSVITCRILLNKKGYSCNTTSAIYDNTLQDIVKRFQTDIGFKSDGLLGQKTLAVLEDTQSATGWFSNGTVNIPAGKLALMGFGKLVLKPANVAKLNEICNEYGMNTKTKVRHFLAQGLIETLYGTTFVEGIYRPGDPSKYVSYAPYCGAGFIQLTWADNYQRFQTYMKDVKGINAPRITAPSVYATQYVADTYPFVSAGWFWDIRKDINAKIVQWASLSAADTVRKVTYEVKGSESKYEIRLEAYEKAKQIFL